MQSAEFKRRPHDRVANRTSTHWTIKTKDIYDHHRYPEQYRRDTLRTELRQDKDKSFNITRDSLCLFLKGKVEQERASTASPAKNQTAQKPASPPQPAKQQAAPESEDTYKRDAIVFKDPCKDPNHVHQVYADSAQRQKLKLNATMTKQVAHLHAGLPSEDYDPIRTRPGESSVPLPKDEVETKRFEAVTPNRIRRMPKNEDELPNRLGEHLDLW